MILFLLVVFLAFLFFIKYGASGNLGYEREGCEPRGEIFRILLVKKVWMKGAGEERIFLAERLGGQIGSGAGCVGIEFPLEKKSRAFMILSFDYSFRYKDRVSGSMREFDGYWSMTDAGGSRFIQEARELLRGFSDVSMEFWQGKVYLFTDVGLYRWNMKRKIKHLLDLQSDFERKENYQRNN